MVRRLKKIKNLAIAMVVCCNPGFSPVKGFGQGQILWQLGKADNRADEFALGPSEYGKFLSRDFGFEDRYFLAGFSDIRNDFPYVLPGPADSWGGTGGTSGWRTHEINILFGLKDIPASGKWKLVIDLIDSNPHRSLLKVSMNSKQDAKFPLKGGTDASLTGASAESKEQILEVPINEGVLKNGGNCVTLTVLEGSWVVFDHLRLEAPDGVVLAHPDQAFIRSVQAANYELEKGTKRVQPLLVDVEHLSANPVLEVELDGKNIFKARLDTARYQFEAPMAAVSKRKESRYRILINRKEAESGTVDRFPAKLQTPAGYVDTRIGTAHSRWMIAPGPWMPFSMVKLSP
ncbi:MAG: polysaccharide lyase family protein, partial [Prolixibacteraceae bacterium]